MKKYSIIIMVFAMLLCCTASMAAPVDSYEVDSTGALIIEGKTDGAIEGTQYNIVVFGKDKTYDETATYDDAKIAEDIIFMSQVPAKEDGSYTVRVGMKDHSSGFYTVRVNGNDAARIYFATAADKRIYLGKVRSICQAGGETAVTELEKLLDLADGESDAINLFMLSDKNITGVEPSVLADVLYDEVKANPLCVSSEEKFVEAITKSARVAALSNNTIAISELFGVLAFDSDYVTLYNEKLTDKAKKSVAENSYVGKGYNAVETVAEFTEAVAYAYISNFVSWSDAKYFIEEIGKDFDVNVSKYNKLSTSKKSDLYDYMTDKASKTSVKAFVKDVNNKIDDLDDGGSSGGGGGGGGGFSSNTTSGYVPVTPEVEKESFTDMAGFEWAQESVDALYEKGIVSGVGDMQFAPGKMVTREEMITMLIRAYNVSTEGAATDKFTDVASGSWYAPYVAAAFKNGYVSGVSETAFGTGANITRQDASVMAYNIAKASGKSFGEASEKFADDANISDYAKNAVYALKANGVINGKGDNAFAPKDGCTRAEAAVIIYKLIK